MGFFRNMFGSDSAAAPSPAVPAPISASGEGVHYDAKLIDSLQADHARLGSLYARVGEQAEREQFNEVRALLGRLKTALQSHILVENVRFYSYLEKSLDADADNAATMHEFRRDMNTIARQIIDFVKKWQASELTAADERSQFTADYKQVGKLLEQRFDAEENDLYPLYQPS